MNRNRNRVALAFAALAVICFCAVLGAQTLTAPKFKFDPDWPKPLPNKWKLGGVTGLAVDKDDNVWVLIRPNDLTDIELEAEIGIADCCVRPPSMIHFDKQGNVIGSFDAPQGHGMAVDSKGSVYIGQDTVRKYDPKTGKVVAEVPRTPERPPGAGGGIDLTCSALPPSSARQKKSRWRSRRARMSPRPARTTSLRRIAFFGSFTARCDSCDFASLHHEQARI